jgi:Mn2+/Fe2+ NRAMP family transporter
VLDGLVRLHPLYAPVLFVAAVLLGHVHGASATVGVGEIGRNMFGFGPVWMWATVFNGTAWFLVFRSGFRALEYVFFFFLAVLSVSFIGSAIWIGFNPADVARGMVRLEMPDKAGAYDPALVALAMIGAVGGSLMNLVYPYFIDEKGWRGPAYRRVQFYDLLLGIIAMLVLNLSVWVLGAELLYPDRTVEQLEDLPNLLSLTLGEPGRMLFYAGIFAAVYTSLVGVAAGLGRLGTHAWLRWREGAGAVSYDFRSHACFKVIAVSSLISPLVWTVPGAPGFVAVTLVTNSMQVILLPMLAGGLWWITASRRLIGDQYKNRWWENCVMGLLVSLAGYFAFQALRTVVSTITGST